MVFPKEANLCTESPGRLLWNRKSICRKVLHSLCSNSGIWHLAGNQALWRTKHSRSIFDTAAPAYGQKRAMEPHIQLTLSQGLWELGVWDGYHCTKSSNLHTPKVQCLHRTRISISEWYTCKKQTHQSLLRCSANSPMS